VWYAEAVPHLTPLVLDWMTYVAKVAPCQANTSVLPGQEQNDNPCPLER
jgi:hypothetical protein